MIHSPMKNKLTPIASNFSFNSLLACLVPFYPPTSVPSPSRSRVQTHIRIIDSHLSPILLEELDQVLLQTEPHARSQSFRRFGAIGGGEVVGWEVR